MVRPTKPKNEVFLCPFFSNRYKTIRCEVPRKSFWSDRIVHDYYYKIKYFCSASQSGDVCDVDYRRLDGLECRRIDRLIRAFKKAEFDVIRFYWVKAEDQQNWLSLVERKTGFNWGLWQARLGKYLTEKCRLDKECSFKALLPTKEEQEILNNRRVNYRLKHIEKMRLYERERYHIRKQRGSSRNLEIFAGAEKK